MRILLSLLSIIWLFSSCTSSSNDSNEQTNYSNPEVHHRGSVKNVHRNHDFSAHVQLDTLDPVNLYAIGPAEGLDGEFFIMGDRGFVYRLDTAANNTYTDKNWRAEKAAFLVWSYVEKWDTVRIDQPFDNLQELEHIIATKAANNHLDTNEAFPFMAWTSASSGKGHVMNESLRLRSENRSHSDAKFSFEWMDQPTQLLGFFSPNHGGIFTHHGDRLHIHFRLGNKYRGGHVDAIEVNGRDWMLLLPAVN